MLVLTIPGSALFDLAIKNKWPIVYETLRTPSSAELKYASSLLPKNPVICAAVEKKFIPKFESVLAELSAHPSWPKTTVDRSIGVNGLAMFVAALELLEITHTEFTRQNMLSLALDLTIRFTTVTSPLLAVECSEILDASTVLASQTGNVVFGFTAGMWRFTCGNLSLPISQSLCKHIGRKCHPEDCMLSLRSHPDISITHAIKKCLSSECSFEDSWAENGIPLRTRDNFMRVLLVAPYGTANGDASSLPFIAPHWVIDNILTC